MRCGDCRHFVPHKKGDGWDRPGFGSCARWEASYQTRDYEALKYNEVIVECDEGWGAFMGENFGCVLFERKGGPQ